MKLHRNEVCPCGSGVKYKKCCYPDRAKNAEIIRAAAMATSWVELRAILSTPVPVYRLKVALIQMKGMIIEEEVSRTLDIEGNETLYDLHLAIQKAFQWDNDHMFSFYTGGKLFDRAHEYSGTPLGDLLISGIGPPAKSAAETQLRDLHLHQTSNMLYLFDFGDELVHEVTVESIHDKKADMTLPAVISAVGTPPPQYEYVD
mgnify:CR=1 FL=1